MLESPLIDRLIHLAIDEDLAYGDVTARLTIDPKARSVANFVAREPLVVCGQGVLRRVFRLLDWPVEIEEKIADGGMAEAESVITRVTGPTSQLVSAERTILNFMQRLSGVATYCHRLVQASHGVTILDTRKTMPGWRLLEKYAITVGGGTNHRYHLGDMILIKNNHIDANAKDIPAVMRKVQAEKPFYMPVEVEVRDFAELEAVLPFDPEVIMLDNMNNQEIQRALTIVKKSGSRAKLEISGGITAERLPSLAAIGVRNVSVGALTTRAINMDISMRIHDSF